VVIPSIIIKIERSRPDGFTHAVGNDRTVVAAGTGDRTLDDGEQFARQWHDMFTN
jgi:hypothetical protein